MLRRLDGAPTEQNEPEHEACTDGRVVPVEAGGNDLRLADLTRLRADEFDLVAGGSARRRPDGLDLVAAREGVIVRHRARHAVIGGDDVAAGRPMKRAYELDLVAACLGIVAGQRPRHSV